MTEDNKKEIREIDAVIKDLTIRVTKLVTTNIELCSERNELHTKNDKIIILETANIELNALCNVLRTENDKLNAQLTELKIRYEKIVVLYATNTH